MTHYNFTFTKFLLILMIGSVSSQIYAMVPSWQQLRRAGQLGTQEKMLKYYQGAELRNAAAKGDFKTVLIMIQNPEIDINAKDKVTGDTALHIAARKGKTAIVQELLIAGADRTIKNKWGETAADVDTTNFLS